MKKILSFLNKKNINDNKVKQLTPFHKELTLFERMMIDNQGRCFKTSKDIENEKAVKKHWDNYSRKVQRAFFTIKPLYCTIKPQPIL